MDYAQWYSIPPHVSFAVVWFIPLLFAWDSNLWVTASTVAGVVLVLLLGYFIKCMVKRLV